MNVEWWLWVKSVVSVVYMVGKSGSIVSVVGKEWECNECNG